MWEALKLAFLTRNSTLEFMRFESAKELFNMKQQRTQPVYGPLSHIRQLNSEGSISDGRVVC